MKNYKELKVNLRNYKSTIELMDKFEGMKENVDYDRLIFLDEIIIHWNFCDLVVERTEFGTEYKGDITLTQLKNGKCENYSNLVDYIEAQATEDIIKEYEGKNKILYFKNPFLLRAQNSCNRTGYGWNGPYSFMRKLYGDTNEYGIVGIYIN